MRAALFDAGGVFTLLAVLQDVASPPPWRLSALQALWRACQDVRLLGQFCEEVGRQAGS